MSDQDDDNSRWWGRYDIPEDSCGLWHIGPLSLWVAHRAQEWRIAYDCQSDMLAEALQVRCPLPDGEAPALGNEVRLATGALGDTIAIGCGLADRAVVARPEKPLYLLADDEVSLFVGSPVWVRLEGAASGRLLAELPSYRPSDTWMGPSTLQGELCYAARTNARLRLEDVQWRPARAITKVVVRNQASDRLLVERLSLPMPSLSLYADSQRRLWTQQVELERAMDGKIGRVRLAEGSPEEAAGAQLLSSPRNPQQGVLSRALDALFG